MWIMWTDRTGGCASSSCQKTLNGISRTRAHTIQVTDSNGMCDNDDNIVISPVVAGLDRQGLEFKE